MAYDHAKAAKLEKQAFAAVNEARRLRDVILSGTSNQRPVLAWAEVVRACFWANNAYRAAVAEMGGVCTRADLSFFRDLNALWWSARAQVETLAARAAA